MEATAKAAEMGSSTMVQDEMGELVMVLARWEIGFPQVQHARSVFAMKL